MGHCANTLLYFQTVFLGLSLLKARQEKKGFQECENNPKAIVPMKRRKTVKKIGDSQVSLDD